MAESLAIIPFETGRPMPGQFASAAGRKHRLASLALAALSLLVFAGCGANNSAGPVAPDQRLVVALEPLLEADFIEVRGTLVAVNTEFSLGVDRSEPGRSREILSDGRLINVQGRYDAPNDFLLVLSSDAYPLVMGSREIGTVPAGSTVIEVLSGSAKSPPDYSLGRRPSERLDATILPEFLSMALTGHSTGLTRDEYFAFADVQDLGRVTEDSGVFRKYRWEQNASAGGRIWEFWFEPESMQLQRIAVELKSLPQFEANQRPSLLEIVSIG